MVSRSAFLAALTGATVAVAAGGATPTVSLLLPVLDDDRLVGSVINVESDKTTYAIGCATDAPDTPEATCYIGSISWTAMQGKSTMSQSVQFVQDPSATYTQVVSCKFNSRSVANCDIDNAATISGSLQTTHFHTVISRYQTAMSPVTITAAAEKLSATAGPSKTGDSTAPTSTSSDPFESLPTLTAILTGFTGPIESLPLSSDAPIGASTSTSTTAPTTTTTRTGNVAGPRVTQNAFLAGVAAAVGGGALLL